MVEEALYPNERRTTSCRDIYQDSGLVICTQLGTSLSPRNLNRIWYRLREKANVLEIHFHDLRHTHVAISIKKGQQLPEIAEKIGHSSLQQIIYYLAYKKQQQQDLRTISMLRKKLDKNR